jgi:hypothetical protein
MITANWENVYFRFECVRQFTSAAFNYTGFMHRMSHYDLTLLRELQAGDKLEKSIAALRIT